MNAAGEKKYGKDAVDELYGYHSMKLLDTIQPQVHDIYTYIYVQRRSCQHFRASSRAAHRRARRANHAMHPPATALAHRSGRSTSMVADP
jgi:hypothetical protein